MTNAVSSNKNRSDKNYLRRADVWIALATIILAGIGAWGVLETKHALKLSERAWVSAVNATLTAPIEEGKAIRFNIPLLNFGREPAINMAYATQNGTIKAPPYDDWSSLVVEKNTSCDGLLVQKGAQAIMPSLNGLASLRAFDSEVGRDPMLASKPIIDGTLHYYVRGCIAYETFEELHYSSFCYVLQTRSGVDWQKTLFLNCPSGFDAN
jgi:hypothetical protein